MIDTLPIATLSVTSCAANVSVPGVVDFTRKLAWPLLSVTESAGVMEGAPGPADWLRVTLLPAAPRPSASRIVTVTLDAEVPSAATVAGAAARLDGAASVTITPR